MMHDSKMTEEESSDEVYDFNQKALFVEYPTRPIDLNTVPLDGSEFIHKVRLEAELIDSQERPLAVKAPEENEQKRMRQAARKAAREFSRYALKLTCDKDKLTLKKLFPKKLRFPRNGQAWIQDWCVFCLGSNLCSEIYGENYEEPDEEIEGHLPYFSIVAHFNHYTAFTVLTHLHEWFLSIGMEESLGRWVYAVLACIKKPLDEGAEKLIETFYEDCKKRLKDCDESERSRLYLISAIFECYFCINSVKTMEPTLESILNLTI